MLNVKLNDRKPFSFGLPYMVMDWDGTWGHGPGVCLVLDYWASSASTNEVWFEIVMQGVIVSWERVSNFPVVFLLVPHTVLWANIYKSFKVVPWIQSAICKPIWHGNIRLVDSSITSINHHLKTTFIR